MWVSRLGVNVGLWYRLSNVVDLGCRWRRKVERDGFLYAVDRAGSDIYRAGGDSGRNGDDIPRTRSLIVHGRVGN